MSADTLCGESSKSYMYLPSVQCLGVVGEWMGGWMSEWVSEWSETFLHLEERKYRTLGEGHSLIIYTGFCFIGKVLPVLASDW